MQRGQALARVVRVQRDQPVFGLHGRDAFEIENPGLDDDLREAIEAGAALALFAPIRLMRAVPESSDIGPAWWFATVTDFAIALGGIVTVGALPIISAAGFGISAGILSGA